MATDLHVRWLIKCDIPRVMEIENASFGSPFQEETLLACLRDRHTIGMVIETSRYSNLTEEAEVIGYMVYHLSSKQISLVRFAVDPECRREGVGTAMIVKLKSKLTNRERTKLSITVRESNLAACRFFANQGFRATGVLREHYESPTDDGYTFVYDKNAVPQEIDSSVRQG